MKANFIKRPASAAIAGLMVFAGVQVVAAPAASAYELPVPGVENQVQFGGVSELNPAEGVNQVEKNLKLEVTEVGANKVRVNLIVNKDAGYWALGDRVHIGLPEGVTIPGTIDRYYTKGANDSFDTSTWTPAQIDPQTTFDAESGGQWPSDALMNMRHWHKKGTTEFTEDMTRTVNNKFIKEGNQPEGPHSKMLAAFDTDVPLQGFLVDRHAPNSRALLYTFEAELAPGVNAEDLWWVTHVGGGTALEASPHMIVQGPFDGVTQDPGDDGDNPGTNPGGDGSGSLGDITGSLGGDDGGQNLGGSLDDITGSLGGGNNGGTDAGSLEKCLANGSDVSVSNPLLWLLPLGLLAFVPVPPHIQAQVNQTVSGIVGNVPQHLNINTYISPELQRGLLGAALVAAGLAGFTAIASIGCGGNSATAGSGADGAQGEIKLSEGNSTGSAE